MSLTCLTARRLRIVIFHNLSGGSHSSSPYCLILIKEVEKEMWVSDHRRNRHLENVSECNNSHQV